MPALKLCDPGVYRLAHEASGHFYIGSSLTVRERLRVWRSRIDCVGCGHCGGLFPGQRKANPLKMGLSPLLFDAIRKIGCVGWRFEVLERFPADVRADVLWAAELRHIEAGWSSAAGSFSLNTGRAPPNFLHQWDARFAATGGRDPRLSL